eukprot:3507-Heterococcus_DN1.PRE.1
MASASTSASSARSAVACSQSAVASRERHCACRTHAYCATCTVLLVVYDTISRRVYLALARAMRSASFCVAGRPVSSSSIDCYCSVLQYCNNSVLKRTALMTCFRNAGTTTAAATATVTST